VSTASLRAAPEAQPTAPTAPSRLSWAAIFDYVAPTFGLGFMFLLISIYVLKFATDVLGMSAAAMGMILLLGRGLDAFVDPIVGYFSDRTNTKLGRRRPWLLASVIPLGLTFILLWAPPRSLSPTMMIAWMAVMVVAFYSATSLLVIPHTALGAELTDSYHDRTRIFGGRHLGWVVGSFAAIAGLLALDRSTDVRTTVFRLALGAGIVTAILILWTVWRLRERAEFRGRGSEHPYRAFRDVWRNPHARLLLLVFGIESLGAATIGVLTPYVAQYVVKRPDIAPAVIAAYMVASFVFVPVWLPLSRRFGKKALWLASMLLTSASFGSMFFLGEGTLVLMTMLAIAAGTAASCGAIVGPSIQADVIDWDEHATGERKEGAYFAAWNFVFKVATGLTQALTGFVLTFSGYLPNIEQTATVKVTLLALYGLFPMACYLIGSLLFTRFKLDEAGYAVIRGDLDSRR
jgi:GPH family glycoside/pentoside/hexuronide:cation symporter